MVNPNPKLIPPPTVTIDGKAFTMCTWFPANYVYKPSTKNDDICTFKRKPYANGPRDNGFDQRAQYHDLKIPADSTTMTISGPFYQVAYTSVMIYNDQGTTILPTLDKDLNTLEGKNPFIQGNYSVFHYESPLFHQKNSSVMTTKLSSHLTKSHNTSLRNGEVPVLRPDKQSSSSSYGESPPASDGCSIDYLASPFNSNDTQDKPFKILRVKIPKTFIMNSTPDETFQNYQTRVFSISSDQINDASALKMDFWTVTTRMLEQYKDSDGYAYVFFANEDYVKEQVQKQGTSPQFPPVITWGKYQGFLLMTPSLEILFRYKLPNPSWAGYLTNTPCYSTISTNQPVIRGSLGGFLPEVFQGSETEFNDGHLGAVYNNQSWPQ